MVLKHWTEQRYGKCDRILPRLGIVGRLDPILLPVGQVLQGDQGEASTTRRKLLKNI